MILAVTVAACAAGRGSERDSVTDFRDMRGAPDGGTAAATEGYAYVARRRHGVVALVGAHFVADEEAHRIVDRIADELDACAERLGGRGALASGALQLVAVGGARGTAEISDLRVAPGGAVAANALECIVAPLRASPFPAVVGGRVPAIAIDATWAPTAPR